MNKFSPSVANEIKNVSPILYFLGIFYFVVSLIVPKLCQYFIAGMTLNETVTNVSTDFDNARIHFY